MATKVGVVGLGSIGLRMLEAFVADERFSVSAVWDPSPKARSAAAAAYPTLPIAQGADEFYSTQDIDLVYIACPPAAHREHALRAMAGHKRILCEKPLGVDLDESEDLVRRVEADGVPNAVNLLLASARAATELTAAIEDGRLGHISWVDIHLHLPQWAAKRYAEAPWLMTRAEGGFVREVTTHYLFLCRRLFGDLDTESRNIDYPHDGVSSETFANVHLTAKNTRITLTGSTLGAGPEMNHVTFWGENAAYRIRDLHRLDKFDGERWMPAAQHGARPELDTYFDQLENLHAWLTGQPHRLADFREALETQRLVEAILT
ncbi:MAG: Gfo/Idh/MocA family oxidoreductase [Gammaproteobacteria bacterium]|nr:Gfo/Idh/MocA family oxidoreductase [Gammaproteobacteria bacterium]